MLRVWVASDMERMFILESALVGILQYLGWRMGERAASASGGDHSGVENDEFSP